MKIRRVFLALLLVGVVGCALVWGMFARPRHYSYEGYFKSRFSMRSLIDRIDPKLTVEGTGGGGGGGTGSPYMTDYTHLISSERPISEEIVNSLRSQVLADLRNAGITALKTRDAAGCDSRYPANGIRLSTWGFQVLYDDNGWRGTLTVRLMAKSIQELDRLGHKAELSENIAVFAR